jgi:hypothetical protein
MRFISSLALSASMAFFSLTAGAEDRNSGQTRAKLIEAGRMIDTQSGRVLTNQMILVEHGKSQLLALKQSLRP